MTVKLKPFTVMFAPVGVRKVTTAFPNGTDVGKRLLPPSGCPLAVWNAAPEYVWSLDIGPPETNQIGLPAASYRKPAMNKVLPCISILNPRPGSAGLKYHPPSGTVIVRISGVSLCGSFVESSVLILDARQRQHHAVGLLASD